MLRIESFDTGQLAELSFLPPNTPMRSGLEGAGNAKTPRVVGNRETIQLQVRFRIIYVRMFATSSPLTRRLPGGSRRRC
jgi:hypothetical protein